MTDQKGIRCEACEGKGYVLDYIPYGGSDPFCGACGSCRAFRQVEDLCVLCNGTGIEPPLADEDIESRNAVEGRDDDA